MAGIADNADVTPSWVPPSDPGYQTVSDVTAAISGKQDTLEGVGVTIQNNHVNIAQDVGTASIVLFGALILCLTGQLSLECSIFMIVFLQQLPRNSL